MRKGCKKLCTMLLASAVSFGLSTTTFARTANHTDNQLKSTYEEILSYAEENGISLTMTYEDFVNGYYDQKYNSVEDYADAYYDALMPENNLNYRNYSGGSGIGGTAWYYNTGTSLPEDVTLDYSKYNLLNVVRPGDIIYEANGGFGLTGHAAIVEGIFYNQEKGINYIRLVEAIGAEGVVRSCLDDYRVDEAAASLYRVNKATPSICKKAVDFCIGQLGASYDCDFQKDTSPSETDWYCSELVWAAYKNQGIDIETTDFLNEPGITPRDIMRSSEVTEINFK